MARSRFVFPLSFCIFLALCAPRVLSVETVKLSSGYDMPVVGFGTSRITTPGDVDSSVTAALESGYRHFDTAFVYENEEEIGKSLKKWIANGGKREDLFITSKLPPFGNKPADVEKFLKLSLEKLGLDYLDLYLIHMPFAFVQDKDKYDVGLNADGTVQLDLSSNPVEVWKEMEKQVKAGRARSIGLSNFNESQILDVWNHAEIKPSNLQVETHAYNQQKALREFCRAHNMSFTGYAPLGSQEGRKTLVPESLEKFPSLLGNDVVKKIADDHKKTTGQILLRHAYQNGIIVIPKSSKPSRIKSNLELFDFTLSEDEMKQLNALDHGFEGRIYNFLFWKGTEKHPQYPFANELKKN